MNKMSIVLKKDYPSGYPEDALNILRAMSFTEGKSIRIVGSMSLRSQVYAGDYDADEVVSSHGTRELVVRDLVRKFKQIIKNVQSIPNTYIGDIKSGSVEEWKIIYEPYNYAKSLTKLISLHDEGIITTELYKEGLKRIKPKVTKIELLALQRDFRPNVIRWTPREVLLGFKKLQDGRKFTLQEAFQTPIITKLDVVSWVQNNRFTDFSVIYQFKNNGHLLNPGMGDIEKSIRENIFMLYHDGNYFKMAKRMFALAKYKKHIKILEDLSPLFNGDVGRIYMVYGDIGTIESILDSNESLPYSKIDFEIDQFKGRLSNISLDKYIHHENQIFKLIDELVATRNKHYSREYMKEILGSIKNILSKLLSYYAKSYLLSKKLMPKY